MHSLRHLWPYAARYRYLLLAGSLCAAAGAAVSALGPYILRLAVDAIQAGQLTNQILLGYGGLILLVACVDGLFKFGQRMLIGGVSHRIDFDLRAALFDRLMLLDQEFYSRMHTGDLMARMTNDLSAVRQFLGPGLSSSFTALLTLPAATVLMLLINVPLTLVVLLLLPLVTIVFVLLGRRMRRAFSAVQDQFGNLSTRTQENFSGIRTIKAYAQEEAELRVFTAANDHYRQLNLRYARLSGVLWPGVTLILGSVAALVLLFGGRLVAQGQITLGELVQFNAYLGLLTWPMIALGWMVNLYQQAVASTERLNAVLQRRPTITSPTDASFDLEIAGEVEFQDVGVRFAAPEPATEATRLPIDQASGNGQPPEDWVLRHISFRVPRGSSLAIVGATGGGKTSLISLLGRVRDPGEGTIMIDGRDVRTLPLDRLRQSIGYVPQETFLFSISLRDNVTFGRSEQPDGMEPASDEQIRRAVEISRLSNDLPQFPDGLDTLIGERGVTLSGGQKQRVAIARAILRNPAILVLDDALSSVDTHTAAQILAGLRTVMRGRTSIIIAQRIATVKDADQIIVLHGGRIVERGTHHALLRQGGRYAAMYRRELLEAELGDDVVTSDE
jgi:ATP-binding cassette, subfamily B, multidrug efflux pump